MSVVLVPIEEDALKSLSAILSLYRRVLARRDEVPLPGLIAFEECISDRCVMSPSGPVVERVGNDYGHEVLTQRAAAKSLGVSARTVRRWIDDEELGYVMIAGRRRIPRAELGRLTKRRHSGGGRLLGAHERPAAERQARPAAGAPNPDPMEV